jgi:hypothetical protein
MIELKAMRVRKVWIAISKLFVSAPPLGIIAIGMPGLRKLPPVFSQPHVSQVWHPKSRSKGKKTGAGREKITVIRSAGATHPAVAPIRITADSQSPFATEAEALMTGTAAGQRLADDTFVP